MNRVLRLSELDNRVKGNLLLDLLQLVLLFQDYFFGLILMLYLVDGTLLQVLLLQEHDWTGLRVHW